MSTSSYESPYDKSVTYRIALNFIREHYPEIGLGHTQDLAWDVAQLIQERQVLPLLTNLAAVSQAFDLLGIPTATRTVDHPDIIDQMAARLPYLLEQAFSVDEEALLREVLDHAGLINQDGQGRTLTLLERLETGIDELLAWRAIAAERIGAAESGESPSTKLIITDPTLQFPSDNNDPGLILRVEEYLSRLAVIASDQALLRRQYNQLRVEVDALKLHEEVDIQLERNILRTIDEYLSSDTTIAPPEDP